MKRQTTSNPIRDILRARGLTVERAAALLGYSSGYVLMSTRVPALMSSPMRERLAAVLGLERTQIDACCDAADATEGAG